jgi:hypothetical protein
MKTFSNIDESHCMYFCGVRKSQRNILNKLLRNLSHFLAASTECSAGSNDHFVVGVVPSLVQFDGRPLGGANFQYYHCAITQPCNLATQQSRNLARNRTITQPCNLATQQSRNLARNRTITQPCNTTITQHCNATLQRNNHATLQCNNHATLQRNNHATLQCNNHATLQKSEL